MTYMIRVPSARNDLETELSSNLLHLVWLRIMGFAGAGHIPSANGAEYDRLKELKAFDDTKAGVKGLVDAGVSKIPRIFIRPAEELSNPQVADSARFQIPTIDLQGVDGDRRAEIVDEVRRASSRWGFFQVVNHGVGVDVLDEVLDGVVRFFEQAQEVKMEYYTRDQKGKSVIYSSNFDLYKSKAANWRDTLYCAIAPKPLDPLELPAACRDITMEYSKHVERLGRTLFELLSEALGLHTDHLNEMGCGEGHSLLYHYYPPCPEPELTLGTTNHSDPDFLTVLLQDHIGGLQVLHQDQWVDVTPIHGALVVNIGDLLQLVSNDKFKSVEHRVLANRVGPRISVACFFSTYFYPSQRVYGPIEELLSDENAPKYRGTTVADFLTYYNTKGLAGKSALDHYRL